MAIAGKVLKGNPGTLWWDMGQVGGLLKVLQQGSLSFSQVFPFLSFFV